MWLKVKPRIFGVSRELSLICATEQLPQSYVHVLALVEVSNVNKLSSRL